MSIPGTSPAAEAGAWPSGRAEWLTLGAVIVVAAIVRMHRIGQDSFWLDEAASWWFASRPLAEQWGQIPFYEPHPPLYYTLLWLWSEMFGSGEAALRSLSALAGILTVPVVYGIGRLALSGEQGRWVGLMAALLLALFPTQITYAQEARAYALLTLAVAVLLLSLLWLVPRGVLLDRPLGALLRDDASGVRLALAGVVFGTTGAFWLHNTALVLVSPLLLVALSCLFSRMGFSWQVLRNLVIVGLVILLLWLPNLRWLLSGFSEVASGFWLQPPHWIDLAWGGDELLGSGGVASEIGSKTAFIALNCLIIVLGTAASWRQGRHAQAVLLAAAVALPLSIAILVSYLVTPIFMTRVLVWIEVPAVVLAAAATLWISSAFLRNAVATVVLGLLVIVWSSGWGRQDKEPWKEVARIIVSEATEADLIVADTAYAQVPMLYYRVPDRSRAQWLPLPEAYPSPVNESGYPDGFFLRAKVDDGTLERLGRAAESSRRVWHVSRGRTVYDLEQRIAGTLREARGAGLVRVVRGESSLLTQYGD